MVKHALARLMALVCAMAGISVAYAADLPSRAPAPAPVFVGLPVAMNFTGFYAGVDAGFGLGHEKQAYAISGFGGGFSVNPKEKGLDVGIHAGYGVEVMPLIIAGIEGSVQTSTGKASASGPYGTVSSVDRRDLVTLAGRIGTTYFDPRVLVYGKAGYAGGSIRSSADLPGLLNLSNGTLWHHGFVVGAGAEYAITSHWVAGLEYDYVRLSTKTITSAVLTVPLATQIQPSTHQVLLRASYRF